MQSVPLNESDSIQSISESRAESRINSLIYTESRPETVDYIIIFTSSHTRANIEHKSDTYEACFVDC